MFLFESLGDSLGLLARELAFEWNLLASFRVFMGAKSLSWVFFEMNLVELRRLSSPATPMATFWLAENSLEESKYFNSCSSLRLWKVLLRDYLGFLACFSELSGRILLELAAFKFLMDWNTCPRFLIPLSWLLDGCLPEKDEFLSLLD